MHLLPFKSKQEDFSPSGTVEFEGFVPPRMGDGGRTVIKGFFVRIFGTITVAAANWDGRAVPRLIQHIAVETRAGTRRWSLSGEKSRAASIYFCGMEKHNEHADVVVGAGAAVDLLLYIPMEKPKLKRGVDFALPADVFSKIVITWNSLAGAASTGVTLSANDLDCYIIPDVRSENAVEVKAEDTVKSIDFATTTETVVKLTGALHDAFIYRETGAGGGASITGIGTVRCDDLGLPPMARQDLTRWYRTKRGLSNTGTASVGAERFKEPVVDGQMLPIVVADHETSLWSGKIVEQAKFNLDAGVANLSLVTREVLPKSQENFNAQAAQYGINPSTLRMKTAGKTQRDLGNHSKRRKQVGVWTAPLPDYRGE